MSKGLNEYHEAITAAGREANDKVEAVICKLMAGCPVILHEPVDKVIDLHDITDVIETYVIVSVAQDSNGDIVYIDDTGVEHSNGISVTDKIRIGHAAVETKLLAC